MIYDGPSDGLLDSLVKLIVQLGENIDNEIALVFI